MLIQGENTYSTVVEADEYVNAYFTKYAPLRVIWSVLDAEEKESYLRNSLTEIEALPFIGRKYRPTQKLAFPRVKSGTAGYCYPYGPFYGGMTDYSQIPQEIKEAQIENALALIGKDCMAQTDKQFMIMQSLGAVKNFLNTVHSHVYDYLIYNTGRRSWKDRIIKMYSEELSKPIKRALILQAKYLIENGNIGLWNGVILTVGGSSDVKDVQEILQKIICPEALNLLMVTEPCILYAGG